MVGSLFLRSYERSERIYAAMQARGFEGEFRHLHSRPLRPAEYARARPGRRSRCARVRDRRPTSGWRPDERRPRRRHAPRARPRPRSRRTGMHDGHGTTAARPAPTPRRGGRSSTSTSATRTASRRSSGVDLAIAARREGRPRRAERRRQEHADAPPQRHPRAEPRHGPDRRDASSTARPSGAIRAEVGLVFQDPDDQLFSPTVFEDVAFGPLHMGVPEPTRSTTGSSGRWPPSG